MLRVNTYLSTYLLYMVDYRVPTMMQRCIHRHAQAVSDLALLIGNGNSACSTEVQILHALGELLAALVARRRDLQGGNRVMTFRSPLYRAERGRRGGGKEKGLIALRAASCWQPLQTIASWAGSRSLKLSEEAGRILLAAAFMCAHCMDICAPKLLLSHFSCYL